MSTMKISFLVTVHNEDTDLDILLEQLVEYKLSNEEDEIVVLDDYSDNPKTEAVIKKYIDHIRYEKHHLNKNFGAHKQYGNELCNGDFIFQIDSDEYFTETLLVGLKGLVEQNPEVDLYLIPRINIIRGLTEERARPWGWEISKIDGITNTSTFLTDDEEYLFLKKYDFITDEAILNSIKVEVGYNFPIINWKSGDYQYRFYRNDPKIKWERELHEHIVGASTTTRLPINPEWALIHDKSIDRQEKQNRFYISAFSQQLNVRK